MSWGTRRKDKRRGIFPAFSGVSPWKEGEENSMDYINAFVVGGIICVIGQILMDKTKLTSARILVLFVVVGVFLTGIGLYEPLVKFAGAGATVPLPGFGYALAKGVIKEVNSEGLMGVLTGGLKATSAGISAAVVFGFLVAMIFDSKAKA